MGLDLETRPVGPADLTMLARLFSSQRNTRRCWCTVFCVSRSQFALGWVTGGNQRRFEAIAAASEAPMGVVATVAGKPIGWGACGPRSRYAAAVDVPDSLIADRGRADGDTVWLLPCLFVLDGYRGSGVTYALVRAAVELARGSGATAIEGWPYSGPDPHSADAFVGHEKVFERVGFTCVDRPRPERAVMRLELD